MPAELVAFDKLLDDPRFFEPFRPFAARQAELNEPDFVELVRWRTGAEGRIAALKRQHGWARTRLRGLDRARTWCGWGVWSHNAIKIAALTH